MRGNGPVPYWSHEELIGAAGAKLRRLVMVKGERTNSRVRFLRTDAYETFSLIGFIGEVLRGEIAIDFDAREMTPGSDTASVVILTEPQWKPEANRNTHSRRLKKVKRDPLTHDPDGTPGG